MSFMHLHVLLRVLLLAWPAGAKDGPISEGAAILGELGADDECWSGRSAECSLNAVQLRGQKRNEASTSDPDGLEPRGPYQQCGGNTYTGVTECMEGYSCFNVSEYFSLCKLKAEVEAPWKKYNGSRLLNAKSEAPLLTFYMYRAIDMGDYPPTNANLASIGGMLWYLHTEVISCKNCPKVRPYSIERIARYKVQVRATQPLFMAGVNFGPNLQFQEGQCTGPGDCDELFAKYGYYIGCNNISSDPQTPAYYNGAIYSLPGGCPGLRRDEKSMECGRGQPGGECLGVPTGNGTCTWSFTDAGQVRLNDLEGITSYPAFKEMGGEEYSYASDRGTNMTFWDGLNDTAANAVRVKKLDALFKKTFPDLPSETELGPASCDPNTDKLVKSHRKPEVGE